MKVLINAKNEPKTGKGKFASRLLSALGKLGIETTTNTLAKVDVALHIGRVHYRSKAKVNVLRLGPAHVNSAQDYKSLNRAKLDSVKAADAIIYQSQYSKKVCQRFIGKTKAPSIVIYNGATGWYMASKPWPTNYKYNIVCATRKWLKQKRLKHIVRAFSCADVKDACLWICGNTLGEKIPKQHNIKCVGVLDDVALGSIFASSNAMVNITYLDACPNAVVEALCAGCPVICTDQGGTHELLHDIPTDGIVIADKPYNFKPIDLEHPPKPRMPELVAAILHYCQDRDDATPYPKHLFIDAIAQQYVRFFERLL